MVLVRIFFPLPLGERERVRGKNGISDIIQNIFWIAQYLVIPKSQHLIPFSPEPFIPHLIAWIACMLPTIQLYDYFSFEIHKINNILANCMLTTKLETFNLSVSQIPP